MVVYIFDTDVLSNMLQHYYPGIFPKFWRKFDRGISRDVITSVRQVQDELEKWGNPRIDHSWIKKNERIFTPPTEEEATYMEKILTSNDGAGLEISKKGKKRDGFLIADTWLIAKAYAMKGTVVTEETREPEFTNRIGSYSKIPDVCDNRKIPCINLEEFMSKEEWRF